MSEQFTIANLDLILESLNYSKLKVGGSQITHYELKKDKSYQS